MFWCSGGLFCNWHCFQFARCKQGKCETENPTKTVTNTHFCGGQCLHTILFCQMRNISVIMWCRSDSYVWCVVGKKYQYCVVTLVAILSVWIWFWGCKKIVSGRRVWKALRFGKSNHCGVIINLNAVNIKRKPSVNTLLFGRRPGETTPRWLRSCAGSATWMCGPYGQKMAFKSTMTVALTTIKI